MANGAAPGPSGLTSDHLLALTNDTDSFKYLSGLLTKIASGNLPNEAKQYLLASNLIALQKPNNSGIRPIAII